MVRCFARFCCHVVVYCAQVDALGTAGHQNEKQVSLRALIPAIKIVPTLIK